MLGSANTALSTISAHQRNSPLSNASFPSLITLSMPPIAATYLGAASVGANGRNVAGFISKYPRYLLITALALRW
ncbi:Uncharacterised protein [Vibrio cholerae]|nr:Uncharacterised protein [Vibrio cholerae]